jgi:hypothetical protein
MSDNAAVVLIIALLTLPELVIGAIAAWRNRGRD